MALPPPAARLVLDIGCGTGLVCLAAWPMLGKRDRCVGLDTQEAQIAFCRRHYAALTNLEFRHHDAANPHYNPAGEKQVPWAIADGSVDLATALSVWTHLDEPDARHMMREVGRVLRPGGRAIVSFFLLDDQYDPDHITSGTTPNRHNTAPGQWVFDRKVRGREHWFHPAWAKVPEAAIAIDEAALALLCEDAGLNIIERFNGLWKQTSGLYMQDIVVFEKPEIELQHPARPDV